MADTCKETAEVTCIIKSNMTSQQQSNICLYKSAV